MARGLDELLSAQTEETCNLTRPCISLCHQNKYNASTKLKEQHKAIIWSIT